MLPELVDSRLVDSRLVVPSPPPWYVARPRLLTALDDAADLSLVLLSAAPGAGKTVLLADWARRRQGHVAFVSPAPDDNEPGRFRALLTAALRLPPDPVSSLAGAGDFVHWLRGQLPREEAPLVLAIDDAHVLADPQIADLLDQLVRYGHPQLHLVLAARHDPPLPLHRYRLAGQLRELRMPELAMTVGEQRDLLLAHQVVLPTSALNVLAARTEGWAAGVRLAAMRMQRAPALAGPAGELSFDYGSVGEYFLAEVLGRLPEPLCRLLIETSFLDEVTAPLAEAITDLDGAGEMLAELAACNWFVIALDPAGSRFRYHRLFAEVLRHLLVRDKKHSLREFADRAAACLEREGNLEGALRWAVTAGDPRRAASVLVRGGLAHAFAYHRAIPAAELAGVLPATAAGPVTADAHPDIRLAALALRAATADSAAAARKLAHALTQVPADRQPDAAARQTATLVELMIGARSGDVRGVDHAASRLASRSAPLGCTPDGKNPRSTGRATRPVSRGDELSRHGGLPPPVSPWPYPPQGCAPDGNVPPEVLRAAVLLAQASAHFWDGAGDDVRSLLNRALAQAEGCGLLGVQADVLAMMAYIDSYRGRPRHADDAALAAHRLLRGHPGLRTPAALRLAAVIRSIQQADFPAAARTLRHTSPSATVSADPGLDGALTLWRATLLALSGEPHQAQALLAAGTTYPALPLLDLHRDVLLGEIETQRGRPRAALERFQRHRKGRLAALVDVPCARAYLAIDDLDSARQSIRRTLAAPRPQFSRYLLVDSMLLDARIAERTGDTGRALDVMTNALDVAGEEVILPFVQAGAAFGGVLARHPAVACRWPGPAARTMATTRGSGAVALPEQGARDLPVQLTPREQSVLDYLATSLTAADIAAEMYLSVNTVKTHIAAIYQKLGAGRRREAVRRARELELL